MSFDKRWQPKDALASDMLTRKIANDVFTAVKIGDVEWLKKSLQTKNISLVLENPQGLCPIHIAAVECQLLVLQVLIEELSVDVNLANSNGWCALHLAINNKTKTKSLKCARYLIEKGADVSCRSLSGVTPLHQAASVGHLRIVQLLIENHAQLDHLDDRGHTPYSLAKLWGMRECARILAHHQWIHDKNWEAKEQKKRDKQKLIEEQRLQEELSSKKKLRQVASQNAFIAWLSKNDIPIHILHYGMADREEREALALREEKRKRELRSTSRSILEGTNLANEADIVLYENAKPTAIQVVVSEEAKPTEVKIATTNQGTTSRTSPANRKKYSDRHVDLIPLSSINRPSTNKKIYR